MDNDYILTHILSCITDGSTYKAACLVSRHWCHVASKLFDKGDVFANHLMTLLMLHPDAYWDYLELSKNPNLKMWYVRKYPKKPWDWYFLWLRSDYTMKDMQIDGWHPNLAKNKNITPEYILAVGNDRWSLNKISQNPCITLDIIKKYPTLQYDKKSFTMNPNIKLQDILDNPDYFRSVSNYRYNPNCTWNELCYIRDTYGPEEDDFCIIEHPSVTINTILYDPKFDPSWSCCLFYENPNFDFRLVLLRPSENWNWAEISKHPNVTWDIISSNPKLPWVPDYVSQNPNVTIEIVRNNPTFSWNYRLLCSNPSVICKTNKMEILHELCDYNVFSRLPYYFSNPNFSWRDYEQLNVAHDFRRLSANLFNYKK